MNFFYKKSSDKKFADKKFSNKKWGKNVKRTCTGFLAACLCASGLAAVPVRAEGQDAESAKGRYLESEVTLPEGFYVRDIVQTEAGALRIVGNDSDGSVGLWDSQDEGGNWERTAGLPEEYNDVYFTSLKLNQSGGGAGVEMVSTSEENDAEGMDAYDYYFVSFDAQGNAQKTKLSDDRAGYILQYSAAGDLIGMPYGGTVQHLDAVTGEEISTLTSTDADMIGVCGTEALVVTKDEVQRYDISTGEPISRDEALNEALYADGANYQITTSAGYPIVFAQDEEGRLFYVTSNGIFSHMMGGSAVEQVVDGRLCSLSDPTINISAMAVLDQKFYLAYANGQGEFGMMKYEYDPEVDSEPATELTVYSLKKNESVQQAIAQYQKENPDVLVNYKVGMSGGDGVTASDALRTLNTDILGGNGPDVLVMDGISVQTYASKDMLMDMTSILEKVKESDGVVENIAGAYQQEDFLPAIPTKFSIPMIAGESDVIEGVDGLDSLVELAKEAGTLTPMDVCFLPEILYPICSGSWKNEDQTINQEKLAEYVNTIQQVSADYKESASEDDLKWITAFNEADEADYADMVVEDIGMGVMNLLAKECKVKLGTMKDINTYAGISSVNVKNQNVSSKLMNGQNSNVFIPETVLGILSTTSKAEEAEGFVTYMLSYEGEMQDKYHGFPVNKKAFDANLDEKLYMNGKEYAMSVSTDDTSTGEMLSLDYTWPTEEEISDLKSIVDSLTVRADMESVQKSTVITEVRRCMNGEISAEEAVNSIMQKLNLYLAE